MKKKHYVMDGKGKALLLFIVVAFIAIIPGVNATSYSGTIYYPVYVTTDTFSLANHGTAIDFMYPQDLWVYDIQNTFDGMTYLLSNAQYDGNYYVIPGSPGSASTPVTGTVGGFTVFTGTIGYNINTVNPEFSSLYIDVGSSVNVGTLTGSQIINLTYNPTAINNFSLPNAGTTGAYPGGLTVNTPIFVVNYDGWGGPGNEHVHQGASWYTRGRSFLNGYSLVKDDITGKIDIDVLKVFGANKYASKVNISSNGVVFFDEGTLTRNDVNTLTYANSIHLTVIDSFNRLWAGDFFTPNFTTTLNLNVYDAVNHNAISGAIVGLQNLESGAWTYATTPTGYYTFSSSNDGVTDIPLHPGQTINVSASATGYSTGSKFLSIPYSGYTTQLNLIPTYAVNATGTFWLTVDVVKNEDGTPLNSAVVQVLSGGNSYQQYTGDNGVTTFQNITSGVTFSVTAFAQAYGAQTKVLPKDADFMNTSFSLVRIGLVPVTTPGTPVTTATVAVAYTNAAGQPISTSEGRAYSIFEQLAAELGGWFNIARGIVELTLLWMVIDAATGGKILRRMMNRGRGGRRQG